MRELLITLIIPARNSYLVTFGNPVLLLLYAIGVTWAESNVENGTRKWGREIGESRRATIQMRTG